MIAWLNLLSMGGGSDGRGLKIIGRMFASITITGRIE